MTAPLEADKELDNILDCTVTGPDTTIECARGTPCKHMRTALLAWRNKQVGAARIDELNKLYQKLHSPSVQPLTPDFWIEDRIRELSNGAKDE